MRDIFEPQLSIDREPYGEYTLKAVTLTPNGCYAAGGVVLASLDYANIPEALPVVLLLRYSNFNKLLFQSINPVHHRLPNLLNLAKEKKRVVTFVVIDGRIVGSSSIDLKSTGVSSNINLTSEEEQSNKEAVNLIDTSNWSAWIVGESLLVEGTVTLAHPGYEVTLEESNEQEDSYNLNLKLQVEPILDFNWPSLVTTRSVQYRLGNYTDNHKKVVIKASDLKIYIKVEKLESIKNDTPEIETPEIESIVGKERKCDPHTGHGCYNINWARFS